MEFRSEAIGYAGMDKSLQVKVLVESAKLHGIEVTPELFKEIIDKVYLTGGERPPAPRRNDICGN